MSNTKSAPAKTLTMNDHFVLNNDTVVCVFCYQCGDYDINDPDHLIMGHNNTEPCACCGNGPHFHMNVDY